MGKYIKLFEATAEYNAYTADTENFILPNVSLTVDNNTVYYNPIETRVIAKFNVTDTSSPTPIGYNQYTSGFSEIEIDGVVQPSVVSAYTFSTTGEHTVKYTLTDPTSIGEYAFGGCTSLTSIDIPSGVTSIGDYAFYSCSGLTSVVIPNSVTSIDRQAFYRCRGLTSIDIPNSVTSIDRQAFNGCTSLTSCTIGTGVTSFDYMAFNGCINLTEITIPNSVTSIGGSAFSNCSGLTSATVNATTPPTLDSGAFDNNASGRKIYVPSASVEIYKSASGWSTYASDIEPIP